MSGTVSILQQFANGLKSRSEETRAKAAKDLQHYVTMELREVSAAKNVSSVYQMSIGHCLGTLGMDVFGTWKLLLVRRWGITWSLPLPKHVGEKR